MSGLWIQRWSPHYERWYQHWFATKQEAIVWLIEQSNCRMGEERVELVE